MPGDQSLGAAERADLGVLLTSRVDEQVLRLIVAEVHDDGTGEHGEQGILLKLVGHDRHVRLAFTADTHALLRVADGVEDDHLASGHRHGSDTKAARKETIGHLEETR